MIRVDKIFAKAKSLEEDCDPVNEIIIIEKLLFLETGSIQPISLNEKMITSKQ